MEDLLTLHADVMRSVNQYNVADRLPSHVWLRLRGELYGLVAERAGGRLGWYHRQLKEAAEERYSGIDGSERVALCGVMARYFGNLVPEAVAAKTKVTSQPLTLNCSEKDVWFPTAKINKRRCVEAAPHMLTAAMFTEAETELCSLESVSARAKCDETFGLVGQLSRLSVAIQKAAPSKRVDHYLRWVRKDAHAIAKCPQQAVASTCCAQPSVSLPRRSLQMQFSNTRIRTRGTLSPPPPPCVTWLNTHTLGTYSDFESVLNILQGHTSEVSSVAFNHDGSKIVSG